MYTEARSARALAPIFLGFVLLLLSAGSAIYLGALQREATFWIRHTLEVENRLNHVQTLVVDAESGQRGYLLTGQTSYLAPERGGIEGLGTELGKLARQTSDNPAQRASLARLEKLISAKRSLIRRTIDLRSSGQADVALDVVKSGVGHHLMADIRQTIRGMREEERHLLAQRSARSESLVRWSQRLLVVCILLVIIVAFWVLRDMWGRILALRESNERFVQEAAERRSVEGQLRQLQKMEAVGQLTGGIAHDFNNMLAIVIGSLDMARRRLTGEEHPAVARCIDNASEGAERAATLTARLLAFSRQTPLDPRVVDANKLVSSMSELLRRTIGEPVQIETVLSGGLWRIHADPAQVESALVNLAVNARDSMPDGGKLTIETANTDLDDRYARAHSEVVAGQYVMISVTDTGSGMAPDVLERAFEPFYTTKGVGKGTGLGLSQVFGFVKQSDGHVKIYSEQGEGTTVKVYLPRYTGDDRLASTVSAGEILPVGTSDEIVLVVEDETQVRNLTVDALSELGYTVLQAEGPMEAIQILQSRPGISLLFTDVVMPEMNGRQLAEGALKLQPTLKVLYTTGYTRNAVVHGGILDAGTAFLPKPFTFEQLALKLREVLGS